MILLVLVSLSGSVVGVFVGAPLVTIAVALLGRLGLIARPWWDEADASYADEIRQMQLRLAGGQLLGVGALVAIYARLDVGASAGLAAAATAWWFTPHSRTTGNGLIALVPAALAGAVVAVLASIL